MDFLNSTFFPEDNQIVNLKFLPKAILSTSSAKFGKGSLIVDNACKVKLEKMKDPLILDIEMQIGIKNKLLTQKFFDYACSLRAQNNFAETWVIALVTDKSKEPSYDKSSKSYILKEPKIGESYYLDFIKIHEIYLNSAFQKIKHDLKVNNLYGKEIGNKGKEWFKFLALKLWCDYFDGNNLSYFIPKNSKYHGEEIKNAIKILADFKETEKRRMQIDEIYKAEELNETFENGKIEKTLEIVDYFFDKYKNNQNIYDIKLIGKINKDLITNRFKDSHYLNGFINELKKVNLIE